MTRLAVQSLGRTNLSEAVFAGPPAHAKPARLADAVRLTLDPKSKSVLIQKKWGTPTVCNDGVTIAKEMELEDPEENLGAQMLRQAAEKTGEKVGDGTSTATVLAYAILADGVRNVVAGASAIDLERGLDRGLAAAVQALKSLAKPVDSRIRSWPGTQLRRCARNCHFHMTRSRCWLTTGESLSRAPSIGDISMRGPRGPCAN